MTPPADSAPPRPRLAIKNAIISAFLLFHMFALACWCVPENSPLITAIRSAIRPYMIWAGLFQTTNMFAPNPMKVNDFIVAQVTFADGHNRLWRFPRMEELGYRERCFKERCRKLAEYLIAGNPDTIWPDVARHIARLNRQPSNPPSVVILIRYQSELEPPARDGLLRRKPWRGEAFFVYLVKPEDLT
jgi:hypothetical protein